MAAETLQPLFVYGTLLPGKAPAIIAETANGLRVIGPAKIQGSLYHLGHYPGAVLHSHRPAQIHGQLLELPDRAALAKLDWYEDYVASDHQGSLFVRTTALATLDDGRQMPAWVYVYNRDVSRARLISSGRYDPDEP